jgi:hypothetical protein
MSAHDQALHQTRNATRQFLTHELEPVAAQLETDEKDHVILHDSTVPPPIPS